MTALTILRDPVFAAGSLPEEMAFPICNYPTLFPKNQRNYYGLIPSVKLPGRLPAGISLRRRILKMIALQEFFRPSLSKSLISESNFSSVLGVGAAGTDEISSLRITRLENLTTMNTANATIRKSTTFCRKTP